MIKKMYKLFKQIKYKLSIECCYDQMENRGHAIFGKCVGLSGGDRSTEYLSYDCIGCSYFAGFDAVQILYKDREKEVTKGE